MSAGFCVRVDADRAGHLAAGHAEVRAGPASARRPSASPARCPCPAAARARSGSAPRCSCTSAFMARRRSKSSVASGSTLRPGSLRFALVDLRDRRRRRHALDRVGRALRSAAARSAGRDRPCPSTRDRSVPARCGTFCDLSNCMSPPMSDRPSRPFMPRTSQSVAALAQVAAAVRRAASAGSAMPSAGTGRPRFWPSHVDLASTPSRSASWPPCPCAFRRVWPAPASISIGNGGGRRTQLQHVAGAPLRLTSAARGSGP